MVFGVVGVVALVALAAGCSRMERPGNKPTASNPWESRAIPGARGGIKDVDGQKAQVRYTENPFSGVTQDWSPWRTYAYDDNRPAPAVTRASMPADVKGDAAQGRRLFMSRAKGPCTACHLIQGDDVWPAGNIGPDLSSYGDRNLPDDFIYQTVYDSRVFFPNTSMPPWGTTGVFTPEEIVHIVAFLKTQKSPVPSETDPNRNPNTRAKPVGFGDNLDPTNNPAVLLADDAMKEWTNKGSTEKACADCHAGSPEQSMKGVATRYPRRVAANGRVMAIEDFLSVHAPETTGRAMPSESQANLNMAILVKMQSNGMPVNVDFTSPEVKAALDRGRASFYKKVGQRNHSCADCHTDAPGKGANKFLGGRLLVDVESGMTNHFPAWRTNFGKVWDMRKRMQWCMLPLGMDYLPADSVEYAELELYLTSFSRGKPMSVPGIRH